MNNIIVLCIFCVLSLLPLQGLCTELSFQDGSRYSGETKNNKPDGQGVHIYPDGSKELGTFKNGEFIKGKLISSDQTLTYTGEFKNGELVKGVIVHQGLITKTGIFENLMLVKGSIVFDDGTKQEGEFRKGNLYNGSITYITGITHTYKDGKLVEN